MVRLFQDKDERIHGGLVIDKHASGSGVEVYYLPPPSRLAECGIDPDEAENYKTKLVEFDTESRKVFHSSHKYLGFGQRLSKTQVQESKKNHSGRWGSGTLGIRRQRRIG